MAIIDTSNVRHKVAELLTSHGEQPFSVVAHELVRWSLEIDANAAKASDAWKKRPVTCAFNRIMDGDKVVRDWWPVDGVNRYRPEQNAKDWLARHRVSFTKIETREDIIAEGDEEWFHGKLSGQPSKPRSGAWG